MARFKRLLAGWRERRYARHQRWVEKQAAKRKSDDAQGDLYKHTWTGG